MREYQKPYIQSKEEHEEIQLQEWLSDSHYWVKKYETYVCKWCGKTTTTNLSGDATLCKENPVIKKLTKL